MLIRSQALPGRVARALGTFAVVVVVLPVVACTGSGEGGSRRVATPNTTTTDPVTTAAPVSGPTEVGPGPTAVVTTTTTTTTTVATTDPPSAPLPAPFEATVSEVGPQVRARMDGVSMRPGCPVGYDELRYLRLSHHDFGGGVRSGELVVGAEVAQDVVEVFRRLYEAGFPIRRMTLVDDYGPASDPADGADDFASIEADNTSAFNCRRRTATGGWSEHSYGTAIDLNPLENPYVHPGGTTSHSASRPYLDRSLVAPGVITADGPAVAAFADIGWGWGGSWGSPKDYQHFSRSGR